METPNRVWVVLDHGTPVYCAAWPESCHEHINDAIDSDLPDAGKMVVREYVLVDEIEHLRAEVEALRADAARYLWLASSCRSTGEHWGGRWSIVIEGPAPKSHDSEDDFDDAIDAARAAQGCEHAPSL